MKPQRFNKKIHFFETTEHVKCQVFKQTWSSSPSIIIHLRRRLYKHGSPKIELGKLNFPDFPVPTGSFYLPCHFPPKSETLFNRSGRLAGFPLNQGPKSLLAAPKMMIDPKSSSINLLQTTILYQRAQKSAVSPWGLPRCIISMSPSGKDLITLTMHRENPAVLLSLETHTNCKW